MKQQLLQLLAKPFIGSGIGQTFPWLHDLYKAAYRTQSSETTVVTIPLGVRLEIQANDTGPGLYLASTGEYEPFETKLVLAALKKGDTFIDIGTHVGYYSLLAAKTVGKKGKVVSLEAAPANAELLKKNITRNKLSSIITVIQAAANNKVGTADFYFSNTSSGDHSLTKKTGTKQTVHTTTVDTLTRKLKLEPCVIKMDVEGAENIVMEGMKQTLKRKSVRAVFLEVTPNGKQNQKPIEMLQNAGFSCYLIDEYTKQLIKYSEKSFEKLAKKYGFINIMAERK